MRTYKNINNRRIYYELCRLFNCSLDELFRSDMVTCGESYTNLRVENVPAFRYIKHAVISSEPEGDAIDRVFSIARKHGVDKPRVIGWDFPHLSQEQINVFNMHSTRRKAPAECRFVPNAFLRAAVPIPRRSARRSWARATHSCQPSSPARR